MRRGSGWVDWKRAEPGQARIIISQPDGGGAEVLSAIFLSALAKTEDESEKSAVRGRGGVREGDINPSQQNRRRKIRRLTDFIDQALNVRLFSD